MTEEFLEFSVAAGNDLVTPQPQWMFAGLRPGDRWCVVALRWQEALEAGVAPPVVLEATHASALEFVSMADLEAHAVGRRRPRGACASSARCRGSGASTARPGRTRPPAPRPSGRRRDERPRRTSARPCRSRPSRRQRHSVSRSSARCSSTSSSTPKWMRASRSGARRLDLEDRRLPRLEVELRRWARCHHEGAAPDSHARGVARVERPGAIEIRDVVPGVAGRREACEPEDLVADDVDVLGGHRHELAPELVEGIPVEPACARFELRRVDQVRGSDLGHVNLQVGVLADERRPPRPRGRGGCARGEGA